MTISTNSVSSDETSSEPISSSPAEPNQAEQKQLLSWPKWMLMLPALVCLPGFLMELGKLGFQEKTSFLPIYAGLVLLLIWARFSGNQKPVLRPGWLSFVLFSASLGMLVWGLLFSQATISALSFPVAWLGYVFSAKLPGSKRRSLSFAILLLAVSVSIPVMLDSSAREQIQALTTKTASYFLDLQGILHNPESRQFVFPDRQTSLEQLTSGFDALVVCVCLTLLVVVLHRTNWLQSLILIALSPVWAVLLDSARIVCQVVVFEKRGIDLSTGSAWVLQESLLFFLLLMLIYSSYHFVRFFFNPIDKISSSPAEKGVYLNPYSVLWNRILLFSATVPDSKT